MKLIIGNKNYSSWSLRAWLLLVFHGLIFEEERIPLDTDGYKEAICRHSKAGMVPVLIDNGLLVWDSLAICEYVSEKYLAGDGWPDSPEMRAMARSYCAEMHSGFVHLRSEMPMNCRSTGRVVEISSKLATDIHRIDEIWSDLRRLYADKGQWLFGKFSIADCMFAPVVFRFNTYGVKCSRESREYMRTVLDHKATQHWLNQARGEKETIESAEVGH